MPGQTALVFHPEYEGRGHSPLASAWQRYGWLRRLVEAHALPVTIVEQAPADDADILRVHTPAYLAFVREMDARGEGWLDHGDTPAYRGMFRRSALSVGGTLRGLRGIMAGEFAHAFNPSGGLHHARRDRAGGFCVFNDIVIAVRILQQDYGLTRIVIVDYDGHHGNGTQALLDDEPVLKVSLHMYAGGFYPGTGRVAEMGYGAGHGYAVNIPLPPGVGDDEFLAAFDALVLPLVRAYRPEALIVQCGADGHYADPLVGLRLTTHAYQSLTERVHTLAHDLCDGRLVMLGGGGYVPDNTARCWAVTLGTLAGATSAVEVLHDEEPYPTDPPAAAQVAATVAEVQARIFPLHGLG